MVFTDNTPTKEAIWNGTSPSKQMMLMLRALVVTAMHFNIQIIPKYIRGCENKFANLLSGLQVEKFHYLLKQENITKQQY